MCVGEQEGGLLRDEQVMKSSVRISGFSEGDLTILNILITLFEDIIALSKESRASFLNQSIFKGRFFLTDLLF